jgi:hypothetical protein
MELLGSFPLNISIKELSRWDAVTDPITMKSERQQSIITKTLSMNQLLTILKMTT